MSTDITVDVLIAGRSARKKIKCYPVFDKETLLYIQKGLGFKVKPCSGNCVRLERKGREEEVNSDTGYLMIPRVMFEQPTVNLTKVLDTMSGMNQWYTADCVDDLPKVFDRYQHRFTLSDD